MKSTLFIPFDILPESKVWKMSKAYRVRLVLRQISSNENGSEFELVDATSLEPEDKGRRTYLTDGGMLKA